VDIAVGMREAVISTEPGRSNLTTSVPFRSRMKPEIGLVARAQLEPVREEVSPGHASGPDAGVDREVNVAGSHRVRLGEGHRARIRLDMFLVDYELIT
jgi:hypothetical protein